MRLFATLVLFLIASAARAETIAGRASVIDGDTIALQTQEIQLLGIDAPESQQICWDAAGQPWPCGKKAAQALADKIADAIVTCKGIRRDNDGRLIAVCQAGSENLNAWLVANGWALAYRNYSTAYVAAEEAAREAASGLWGGAFEPPWIWRTKN